MSDKIRIIVVVEGGVVQSAYSNGLSVDIDILDWDNASCEEDVERDAEYEALDIETGTMTLIY